MKMPINPSTIHRMMDMGHLRRVAVPLPRFPIKQVDELRLVRKAERRQAAEPNRYGGVLGGSDDEVYRLTLYDLAERRQIVAQIFKDHTPAPSP